jgi:hypothetical protein
VSIRKLSWWHTQVKKRVVTDVCSMFFVFLFFFFLFLLFFYRIFGWTIFQTV